MEMRMWTFIDFRAGATEERRGEGHGRRYNSATRERAVVAISLDIEKLKTHEPPVLQLNCLLQISLLLQFPPPQQILIVVQHSCP